MVPGGTWGGLAVRDALAWGALGASPLDAGAPHAGGLDAGAPVVADAGTAVRPAMQPVARGTAAATAAHGFIRIGHTYQTLDEPKKQY
ncbi:hypothetical protein GCM10012278_30020 [Nonomuraea glycinis]|uniref:Uncharacterized protein n=1 Tax=Nonomuraea glycinis TaxID=2047744 RepID=A0A918E5N3_9ACTN|nr:hypothetical protein GCM10012278_30020 [Nonomuraea glycinis]